MLTDHPPCRQGKAWECGALQPRLCNQVTGLDQGQGHLHGGLTSVSHGRVLAQYCSAKASPISPVISFLDTAVLAAAAPDVKKQRGRAWQRLLRHSMGMAAAATVAFLWAVGAWPCLWWSGVHPCTMQGTTAGSQMQALLEHCQPCRALRVTGVQIEGSPASMESKTCMRGFRRWIMGSTDNCRYSCAAWPCTTPKVAVLHPHEGGAESAGCRKLEAGWLSTDPDLGFRCETVCAAVIVMPCLVAVYPR